MQCEICGAKSILFRAIIEDTEMAVCKNCSKFGKVLGEIKAQLNLKKTEKPDAKSKIEVSKPNVPIIQEVIVENYSEIVRKKRQQLGMTQEDFAKFVAEPKSIIHKIETETFEPGIKMARKFEKMLKIRLIEEYETQDGITMPKTKSDQFTIGDLITVK